MTTELISLGILFLCAIIGGIIAARIKQPAVLGLLLVGAIIGPNALNLVKDVSMIRMMADFGAILILFIIGLEFDISKLIKLGVRPIILGLLKFGIVLFLGYETALLFGFSVKVALFVGAILSFSSTVVIIKVLQQKGLYNRKEVPLLIAILVIEDILAVLVLTFFSGVKDTSIGVLSTFEHVMFSLLALLIIYVGTMKVLKYIVRIVLNNSKDESVLTFLSLGIGVSFSYIASYLGLTPSAGAFLAGSLIASLPNSKEYKNAIHPYALSFTSIFFISMGTLVNFKAVESNLILIEGLILIIFISRLVAVGFLSFLIANFKEEQPFFSSIAMISIGEFSLLIAKESEKFGLGIDLVTITASIIFISAIIMSISINYSTHLHNILKKRVPIRTKLKLDKVANYMRKFFDNLEIETFFTRKLKSESKAVFKLIAAAILSFFVLRRAAIATASVHYLLPYIVYTISALVLGLLLNLILKRLKIVHNTLSMVLTNVDTSRNIKKCTRIINNLIAGLLLLFTAVVFPFAVFALDLAPWAHLVPFVLVGASIYFLRNMITLLDVQTSQGLYRTEVTAS